MKKIIFTAFILLESISSITHLHPDEQKEHLQNFFIEWKNHQEQTDDITIMGIQI